MTRGTLVDQIEVVTPSSFASCDRIFVGDDGFVAAWRGNEIHGGIVLARRGDAVARVWRPAGRPALLGVTPAPALGGVFAWGPADIFLVRADGSSERVPFTCAPDRRISGACPWGHDVVVLHELDGERAGADGVQFTCIRGDGASFLDGVGLVALPAVPDLLVVLRDSEVIALDRSGVTLGRLSSRVDTSTFDLLGRSRSPFLVLDDGDVVLTNSGDGSVVRWDPRSGTTRWKTTLTGAEPPCPLAPPLRVGGFIAIPPATHASGKRPLWIVDVTTGRVVHSLPLEKHPYDVCVVGDDAIATSCYGNVSPMWRGLAASAPEALMMPHASECLTVRSPARDVVVTGDVSALVFFRV